MDKNIKSDVIISYISIIITIMTTFFLTKIEVKYLGQDMFGVLGLVNSTIGYISIMEMGVGQTVIKYLSQYRSNNEFDNISKLVGHSLKTYIKISIIGLFIGMLIMFNSTNIFPSLNNNISIFNICFFIALINVLLQIPATTFHSVLAAYKEFKFFKLLSLIRAILRFLLISILLVCGFGIISIFLITFILMQISNFIVYIYCKKSLNIKISFLKIDKNIRKELSNYSFYVFLFLITDQIFWKTDSVILGVISSTSVVAVYSISGQIIMQLRQLSTTFSSVFLPRIVEQINSNEGINKVNEFYIKASKYQYIIMSLICITYICVGKEFIILWVGENFKDAYYYSIIIIIATLIPMSQTTSYQILYALNKHRIRSIIFFICAMLNIILSIVLYNIIGALGVSLATAIAMLISDNIFINVYYRYITGLRFRKLFKEAFLLTTLISVFILLVYFFINQIWNYYSWNGLIIKCIFGSSLYLILIYLFALNYNEKEIMKNRFLNKLYK